MYSLTQLVSVDVSNNMGITGVLQSSYWPFLRECSFRNTQVCQLTREFSICQLGSFMCPVSTTSVPEPTAIPTDNPYAEPLELNLGKWIGIIGGILLASILILVVGILFLRGRKPIKDIDEPILVSSNGPPRPYFLPTPTRIDAYFQKPIPVFADSDYPLSNPGIHSQTLRESHYSQNTIGNNFSQRTIPQISQQYLDPCDTNQNQDYFYSQRVDHQGDTDYVFSNQPYFDPTQQSYHHYANPMDQPASKPISYPFEGN